ncbi:MAG: hypothetical protein AABZ53_14325 [Planctomycetota bacterium]
MPAEVWWMIAMRSVMLLVWVFVAWLAGRHADAKGYSFSLGFWLAICLSPLTAWIVLMLLPDRAGPGERRVSPQLSLEIELEKARMRLAEREGAASGVQ